MKNLPRVLLVVLSLIVAVTSISIFDDPLVQAPVLDARENLAWSERIASDQVLHEPMYRALLYPWVLSHFPNVSLVGFIFGVFCHLSSAWLCGYLAYRVWRMKSAAYLSAFLYGVHPVALFFAFQLLDITFAITLFLASVSCVFKKSVSWWAVLGAGLLAGLAVLARPNFLPAVVCLPLAWFLRGAFEADAKRFWRQALASIGLIACLLCGQGLWNLQHGSDFRILPWQGAYNLYAANRDGANGQYYTQRLLFDSVPEGQNTTRMESELLYREATGENGPLSIDAMNAFWRERLLEDVREDPFSWGQLMGRKIIYTLNNWEAYNNLTYAYHKERIRPLRWNPLGWGLLLLLATAGLYFGVPHARRGPLLSLGLLGLAYTAGLLLFFVSARFRLPLSPILCVFAGGVLYFPHFKASDRRFWPIGCLLFAVAVLSFGNWFEARSTRTYLQDEILMAKAASQSGKDSDAVVYIEAALVRAPDRADLRKAHVTYLFNQWLVSESKVGGDSWDALGRAVDRLKLQDASTLFISGVFQWHSGVADLAIEIWAQAVELYPREAGSSRQALSVAQVIQNSSDSIVADPLSPMYRLLTRESEGNFQRVELETVDKAGVDGIE